MNNKLKRFGITVAATIAVLYLLFLIIPFTLTGMVNSYLPQITKTVEDTTGFKLKLENVQLITTPKLTAGLKIGHTDLLLPDEDPVLSADNLQVKISLLPLLIKKIEVDKVSGENINAYLKIEKDGKFLLEKYIPDTEAKRNEPDKQEIRQETEEETVSSEEKHEYFSMKLLSSIHEICVGEQFEEISAPDFYANMNLQSCNCKLKIKAREKIRVCYLIFLMCEKLPKQERDKWKDSILKLLGIEESYYKSKYKEPVSDFPSDSNQNFAKEMKLIFK